MQFHNILIYVLIGAAVITALLDHWIDTGVILAVVVAITVAQFAITYLPPLQHIFAKEAIPFSYGVLIIGIGAALFAIIETEKQIRLAFRRIKEV